MCKHSYGLFQHSFNHSHIQSLLNFFFPLGVQSLIDNFLHINTEKWQQLQYPFTRKVVQDRLQDIQDGNLYRELMQPGGFLGGLTGPCRPGQDSGLEYFWYASSYTNWSEDSSSTLANGRV